MYLLLMGGREVKFRYNDTKIHRGYQEKKIGVNKK